ncbi:NAD(P)H-binding protein [Paenibacillus periandrae]|uniref:NAD(P)H-binding protein n=1 Tax=Paenibacillus periandrae TaxID=1761741 RepID=UPI001F097A19|nr:NAD(P)H-binding protein [Paenibacillus periandrae]
MMKNNENHQRPTIALTGVDEYIGYSLLKQLSGQAEVIALSRYVDKREHREHAEWRACDFFSIDDVEKGLEGTDYAVYLIPSMLSTARLTQAKFEDINVILAEHFGRAAQKNGVKQIVYWSGLVPPDTKKNALSRFLHSRLEVQQILESFGIPVTTIRTGLIDEPESSSLSEVMNTLEHSIGNEELFGKTMDIGGLDVTTYEEMLKQTAEVERIMRKHTVKSDVRSVQRILLPEGKNATWTAAYYLSWLSSFAKPLLRTIIDDSGICRVYIACDRRPLLELTYSSPSSASAYAVYQITGGTFVNTKESLHGRLEFMQIPGTQECIVAIHDYVPSLPWFLYSFTQAKVHIWVMYAFRKNLLRLILQHDL